MATDILILSQSNDVHAFAVAEALRRKGARPMVWLTSDFPTRSCESVLYENGEKKVRMRTPDLTDLGDGRFQAVWYRRPTYVLDRELLHPADIDFADRCCRNFRRGLLQVLQPAAFWVNSPLSASNATKLAQHDRAEAAGLEIPPTLFSNDPAEIRQFIRRHGGRVIFKNQRAVSWRDDDTTYFPFAAVLREEQLVEDEILQAAPGIFQSLVPKVFEVRTTIMGREIISARVYSQDTIHGQVDWRREPQYRLEWLPYELPREVADAAVRLLDDLGLVFGCFDFIVTPEGRHIFLEVNQMGQFLFLEYSCPELPLLDSFADFLVTGDSHFKADRGQAQVSYAEIRPIAAAATKKALQEHVEVPSDFFDEATRS